jgi:integrase
MAASKVTILAAPEVRAMVEAIEGDSSTALRDRAMILTMWRGALRVGEACWLRPDDVDLETGRLDVPSEGKSGHRVVGIDNGALVALRKWSERRAELGWPDDAYLFGAIYSRGGTAPGGKLHESHLRRLLPRLAKEAGLRGRIHPHALRHSRAAELEREGIRVSVIQRSLGHRNLATTSEYLDHISAADVVAAMQGA